MSSPNSFQINQNNEEFSQNNFAPITFDFSNMDETERDLMIADFPSFRAVDTDDHDQDAVYRGVQSDTRHETFFRHLDTKPQIGGFNVNFPKSDAISLLKNAAPMEVQELPPQVQFGYLEPNYHLMTSQPPKALFDTLREIIQTLHTSRFSDKFHVDLKSCQSEKFKIECNGYSLSGATYTHFIIRLFSMPNSNQIALEFQRRDGDATLFHSIYVTILTNLKSRGALDNNFEPPKQRTLHLPPPPSDFSMTDDSQSLNEAINAYVNQLGSRYMDVKLGALEAITEFAFEQQSKSLLSAQGEPLFSELFQCLRSADQDIQRCSLTALKHLTTESAESKRIGEAIVAKDMLSDIIKLTSSECHQIQRDASSLLANISKSVGPSVMPMLKNNMRELLRVTDPSARVSVNRIFFS